MEGEKIVRLVPTSETMIAIYHDQYGLDLRTYCIDVKKEWDYLAESSYSSDIVDIARIQIEEWGG